MNPTQAETHLIVIAPPRLRLDPDRQIVSLGDEASIACIAAPGNVPVDLSWRKEVGDLAATVTVLEQERTSVLKFSSIAATDEGKYVCSGVNPSGRAHAVAEVIVQGKRAFFSSAT